MEDLGNTNVRDPRFKPDWSPELLLSTFYTGPFQAFRTSLVKELGGCRSEFGHACLYDVALRLSAKARHVGHVPQILFVHTEVSEPRPSGNGAQAVEEAFARRGVPCKVHEPRWARAENRRARRRSSRAPFAP